MKMRLKDGKLKVLTLSYDDGVVQDKRLIEIMDKHGLKGTFNINTGWYEKEGADKNRAHGRMTLSEAKELYLNSPHEVAVHTLTHPFLDRLDSQELIYEVIEDKRNIEEQYGIIARGMAYPFGDYNARIAEQLGKCGIVYSRTTEATLKFNFPENWLMLHPTCHHNQENLIELIKKFVEVPNRWGRAEMFYLWGHSYEFDNNGGCWDIIEEFAEYAGGHDHIWYATNIEIYDYVQAYNRLEKSYDGKIIHNPTALTIWFEQGGEEYCIEPGETITL